MFHLLCARCTKPKAEQPTGRPSRSQIVVTVSLALLFFVLTAVIVLAAVFIARARRPDSRRGPAWLKQNKTDNGGDTGIAWIKRNEVSRSVNSSLLLDNGTATPAPSVARTQQPSSSPTLQTTSSPTLKPVPSPLTTVTPVAAERSTNEPSAKPTIMKEALTTFYAIGDVPYNPRQVLGLRAQIQEFPGDADFVVHVGDIRPGNGNNSCSWEDYSLVDSLFNKSKVPIFVVPGDNEYNDCTNPQAAWDMWIQHFLPYPDRYWQDQTRLFGIQRQSGRPENWAFVHNGALFIGLNIVGGRVHNRAEWNNRLSSQATWTMDLIRQHWLPTTIFGHAVPTGNHNNFFLTMKSFIRDELQNRLPVFYLNGDKHKWEMSRAYFDQSNWMQITLTGGVSEPPLRVSVDTHTTSTRAVDVFQYDRRL